MSQEPMCTCSGGSPGVGVCGLSLTEQQAAIARVNCVRLHEEGEVLSPEVLRQRACTELLRQQAQRKGLLDGTDQPGDQCAISEAAVEAIERLLEQELQVSDPSEQACQRYYAANKPVRNELLNLRHILFAVTEGVDVKALRQRAEAVLLELRATDAADTSRFGALARELSNCPSGEQGGTLGWLGRDDCAPEFSRDVFATSEVGVLSRLVHSRFGLHVVEVLERNNGEVIPYDEVRAGVVFALRQQAWTNAVREYLHVLAGQANIVGVEMGGPEASPSR